MNEQRVVSILYAVLIAVISLVIGVLFIFYGMKLINIAAVQKNKSNDNRRSRVWISFHYI